MSISEHVRTALAEQIRGYVQRDCTVVAYPDESADLPSVQVWPGPGYVAAWTTFGERGRATINYLVRVATSNQDGETAMKVMDDFLSPGSLGESSSIVDAIMSDPTLGGVVEAATPGVDESDIEVDAETYAHVAFIPVRVVVRKTGANV